MRPAAVGPSGVYSSYQADLITRMPKKELQAVLIKRQHNIASNGTDTCEGCRRSCTSMRGLAEAAHGENRALVQSELSRCLFLGAFH